MNQLNDILLIAAPLLVAVGVGVTLLRRRGGAPAAPEQTERAAEAAATVDASPEASATQPTAPATSAEPAAPAGPTIDEPTPVAGRMARLRERLARSGSPLGARLLAVLSRDHLAEEDWEELEETLLLADVGAGPTAELVDALRERVRVLGVREPEAVRLLLREQLLALVDPAMDRSLKVVPSVVTDESGAPGVRPAVVLVVGVNGTGKTTTVGKLARVLVAEGRSVLLGAADTFRAAAADQLQTWGARVGVETVRSDRDGADPASVAFETLKRGPGRRGRRRPRRHRRPPAEQGRADGRARQDHPCAVAGRHRSTRSCSSSTPRPDRTA